MVSSLRTICYGSFQAPFTWSAPHRRPPQHSPSPDSRNFRDFWLYFSDKLFRPKHTPGRQLGNPFMIVFKVVHVLMTSYAQPSTWYTRRSWSTTHKFLPCLLYLKVVVITSEVYHSRWMSLSGDVPPSSLQSFPSCGLFTLMQSTE